MNGDFWGFMVLLGLFLAWLSLELLNNYRNVRLTVGFLLIVMLGNAFVRQKNDLAYLERMEQKYFHEVARLLSEGNTAQIHKTIEVYENSEGDAFWRLDAVLRYLDSVEQKSEPLKKSD